MESIDDPFVHTLQTEVTFKQDLRKLSQDEEAPANLPQSIQIPDRSATDESGFVVVEEEEQNSILPQPLPLSQSYCESTELDPKQHYSTNLLFSVGEKQLISQDTFALEEEEEQEEEAPPQEEEKKIPERQFRSEQSEITPTQNFDDQHTGGYLNSPLKFIVAQPEPTTIEKSFESTISTQELKEKRAQTEPCEVSSKLATQEAEVLHTQGERQSEVSRMGGIVLKKTPLQQHPLSPSIDLSTGSKSSPRTLTKSKHNNNSAGGSRRGSLRIDEYIKLTESVTKRRQKAKSESSDLGGGAPPSAKILPRLTKKSESSRLPRSQQPSMVNSPRQSEHSSHYEMNSMRVVDRYYKGEDDSDGPVPSLSPPQGRGEQQESRYTTELSLNTEEDSIEESSPIQRLNLERVMEVEEDDTSMYRSAKSRGHGRSASNGQLMQRGGVLFEDVKEPSPIKDGTPRMSLFAEQAGRRGAPIFTLKNIPRGGGGSSGGLPVASNSSMFSDQQEWRASAILEQGSSGPLSVQNRLQLIEMKRENMKQIQQAILLFNSGKPKIAFEYLAKQGIIASEEEGGAEERKGSQQEIASALASQRHMDIAKFLFHIRGLDKQRIGNLLGANNQDSRRLRHCYASLFEFQNQQFDVSMREFLCKLRLPKQSQQIQRILQAFSWHYFENNRDKFPSEVEAFTLAYSVLLLNVDLHSQAIAKHRKMTKHQFVRNNHDCCATLPENYLEHIYDKICESPLENKIDDIEKAYRRLGLVYGEKELWEDEGKQDLRRSSLGSEFVRGSYFTKYGRYGHPHKKLVRLTADAKKVQWFGIDDGGHPVGPEKHIAVKDVEQVLVGSTHTKVFRKQNIPKQMDNCCISLITEKRTLDLRHENPEVIKKWYNELVQSLKEMSKGKEDELMAAKISNYSSLEVKQAIFEIWSSEILQNWNKYWNSATAQPRPVSIVLNLSSLQLQRITKVGAAAAIAHGNPHIQRKIKSSIARELSTTFQALWLQGVPDPMRKVVWPIVLENQLKLTEKLYEILMIRAEQRDSLLAPPMLSDGEAYTTPSQRRMETEVQKAVSCIKHSDPQFVQTQLLSLLRTFLEYRPDLDYTKGMADIALGFLMSCGSQYTAFVCFTNLLHSSYFMHYFSSDMAEINWRLGYFEDLFELEMPQLSTHFKTLEFTTDMYLLDWYLTLFFRILPHHAALRVWDAFFLRGEIFILQVALALLKYLEPKIRFRSVKHIMQVFGSMRSEESVFNEQLFFSLVADTKVSRQQFESHLTQQQEAEHKSQVFRYFIE